MRFKCNGDNSITTTVTFGTIIVTATVYLVGLLAETLGHAAVDEDEREEGGHDEEENEARTADQLEGFDNH